jgi:choline dehydrogenase
VFLAFRLAAKIAKTKALKRYGAKVHLPKIKICGDPDLEDDAYLHCIIQIGAITGYHPGGTCRIGVGRQAVVDSELK